MNKHLTNPKFDYSQLSKDENGQLKYFERELGQSRKRVASEYVKFGEILHGAQQLMANHRAGVFGAWLTSMGVSNGTAYSAISVYLEWGSFPDLENLEVSAAVDLAKNPDAKKRAMKIASSGTKVTRAMAKQLIHDSLPAPEPEPEPEPESTDDDVIHEESDDDVEVCPKCGHFDLGGPIDSKPGEMWRACDVCDHQWDAAVSTEASTPERPSGGKDKPGGSIDYGKCPNCAGTKWTEDDGGVVCAKCAHPHGEPTGGSDDDRIRIQRSKTVKTAEALMREFDDLHFMVPKEPEHSESIAMCKRQIVNAKDWK